MKGSFFGTLPIQGTDLAKDVDALYIFLVILSAVFFFIVIGAMVYFAIAYRSRPGHKSVYISHHTPLELIWTIVPTILVMGLFVWGWIVYKDLVNIPANAYEIRVLGKQWSWQFIYNDGRVFTGKGFIPMNRPVKLLMTSEDVLHSFFIPNFRTKQDVVPGMYTTVWFEATVPGEHQVYCAEYCGTSHSGMLAMLYALTDEQWVEFEKGREIKLAATERQLQTSQASPINLADQGKRLAEVKACTSCHSIDGSRKAGPTLKGIFGHSIELATGEKVVADENYIRESIEKPAARVAKGFQPVMPTYKGQLSEIELNSLIAYIKSL